MIFSTLRMLALLRRGVRALESLAASHLTLADSIRARETRIAERMARRKSPGRTNFATLDTQKVEEDYQAMLKHDRVERG